MIKQLFALCLIGMPMLVVYVLGVVFARAGIFDLWYGVSPIMHALGGFVTAWTMWMLIWYKRVGQLQYPRYVRVSTTIGVVLIIGIVWEWHELVLELWTGTNHILGVTDTLLDLTMDGVGALVYSYYFTDIDKV
jgi:hypothetical protein